MSTEINYGRKFDLGLGIKGTLQHLVCLGQAMRPKVTDIAQETIAHAAYKLHDIAIWESVHGDMQPITLEAAMAEAAGDVRNRLKVIKDKGSRDPEIDWGCSLSLFPVNDQEFLVIPFAENQQVMSMLDDQQGFTDYSYWTSSDRPDDVPEAEWRARGKQWDEVLGHGIIAKHSLAITLIEDGFRPVMNMAAIEAHQPGMDSRVEFIMNHELGRRLDAMLPADAFGSLTAFQKGKAEYLASPEWKTGKAALESEIQGLLAGNQSRPRP
ncbi:hypothetical protein ACKF11_13205 [Methylobacillus sp. Pita2]|uniref:hypothetical protein n=1 Tax=Methylobacillus sp. Pita2 TaxID=3383245 RepID=UPI0038B4B670